MVRDLLLCFVATTTIIRADEVSTKFQQFFNDACQSQKFMGAVALSVSDQLVFSAACGLADVEWSVKNSLDTRFRIASITKEFTATAVLLLKQENRLSLNDPIGKYVPSLPASWQSATIHQLLTHTSGVPIYTASSDYRHVNPDLNRVNKLGGTPRELIDLVRDRPLMYEHGEKFAYNNTGYILLGMLIESVSGSSYQQFLQKRIFEQLGMNESGFDETRKLIAKRAHGYALVRGKIENADFVDATSAWAAGGLYSTVKDLTKWASSLRGGTLLNSDLLERMFHVYPQAVSQDPYQQTAHYGYGVVLTKRFGHLLEYHGGGISGFNSVLQQYPEVNVVVAVLSNLDSDSDVTPSWTLADGLAKLWFEALRH